MDSMELEQFEEENEWANSKDPKDLKYLGRTKSSQIIKKKI